MAPAMSRSIEKPLQSSRTAAARCSGVRPCLIFALTSPPALNSTETGVLASVDEIAFITKQSGWGFGFTDVDVRFDNVRFNDNSIPILTIWVFNCRSRGASPAHEDFGSTSQSSAAMAVVRNCASGGSSYSSFQNPPETSTGS